MKNWYKSWFNTSYYHLLYKERDHEEAKSFLEKLVSYLNIAPNSEILDLACGKGRHSVYLNKLGFAVTGLDLSEMSIRSLKQTENENLHFVVGDMRKTYKKDHYDLVFNLFTSFGYFHDDHENEEVIASISRSLKKGGIAVIDYLNATATRSELPFEEIKNVEGIDFDIKKFEKNNSVVKKIEFIVEGESKSYSESVKLYTLKNFEAFANTAGLEMIKSFGNYGLDDFNETSSERLILVMKKI